MSCENNSGRVSKSSPVTAGVPAAVSRSGNVAGVMMARFGDAFKEVGRTIQQVLQSPEIIPERIEAGIDQLGRTVSSPVSVLVDFMGDGQKTEAGRLLINVTASSVKAARQPRHSKL